jgi:hypothetical protein
MLIRHPNFPDVWLEAEFSPAEKATDEWAYSLGDPPVDAKWEVTEIHYRGADVTDFCCHFCDHLFSELAEDLIAHHPNG